MARVPSAEMVRTLFLLAWCHAAAMQDPSFCADNFKNATGWLNTRGEPSWSLSELRDGSIAVSTKTSGVMIFRQEEVRKAKSGSRAEASGSLDTLGEWTETNLLLGDGSMATAGATGGTSVENQILVFSSAAISNATNGGKGQITGKIDTGDIVINKLVSLGDRGMAAGDYLGHSAGGALVFSSEEMRKATAGGHANVTGQLDTLGHRAESLRALPSGGLAVGYMEGVILYNSTAVRDALAGGMVKWSGGLDTGSDIGMDVEVLSDGSIAVGTHDSGVLLYSAEVVKQALDGTGHVSSPTGRLDTRNNLVVTLRTMSDGTLAVGTGDVLLFSAETIKHATVTNPGKVSGVLNTKTSCKGGDFNQVGSLLSLDDGSLVVGTTPGCAGSLIFPASALRDAIACVGQQLEVERVIV